MPPMVLAEHVYKSYKKVSQFEINRMFQWMARRVKQAGIRENGGTTGPKYVLKDVNFFLNKHESLGLIGSNGAGKTTLFRLLSSVTLPTKGRVRIEGRVSSLIALGAGFHPDLSGRENLYLNCALMGLSRQQTADRMDRIVDFAELGEHIDVTIKHYSSGMLARLGFSVAVHLDPELILVDEVLAVGDYRFQVKSTAALRDFIQRGTVILVSHDLGAIERICERTIWLEKGEMQADGPSSGVIQQYIEAQQRAMNEGSQTVKARSKTHQDEFRVSRQVFDDSIDVRSVQTQNVNGERCNEFCLHDTIVVNAQLTFEQPMEDVRISVGILDTVSQVIITSCDNQLIDQPDALYGHIRLECRFPNVMLRPRHYGIFIEISNSKALMPLYTYKDIDGRFVLTGERRDPNLHYYAPQNDLMYTPGVEMRFLEVNTQLDNDNF